jgi:hypothetical protein
MRLQGNWLERCLSLLHERLVRSERRSNASDQQDQKRGKCAHYHLLIKSTLKLPERDAGALDKTQTCILRR